jgi:hypothetical protein
MKYEIDCTRKFAKGDYVRYVGKDDILEVRYIVAIASRPDYSPHNRLQCYSLKNPFNYYEACEDFFQNTVTAYR